MFNKVAIIGVGLLGGSFALALREKQLAKEVVGVCRRSSQGELATQLKVIDKAYQTAAEAVVGADLIVLATPMLTMATILEKIQPHISSQCVLTDVGSVKGCLHELLQNDFPELINDFVLAHPIAGGEKSGVSAARADLFVNKHVVLTDTEHCLDENVTIVSQLWEACGANVVRMTSQQHDSVFAYTSHLPHVIAYTLVNNLHHQQNSDQLFNFASAGFYDFTRIASSEPTMWRDICLSNKSEVLKSIETFSKQLQVLSSAIESDDKMALAEIFTDAKRTRDEGLISKG